MSIYKALLDQYGPQHWWPAESRYEVVVGALLTQRTAWRNVEKAISNMKERGLLEPDRVLEAPWEVLEKAVKPVGFYRQKARRLKELTRAFMKVDEKWDRFKMRAHFLGVKGVGKETADSICLYAFDKPLFVIDAYTRRFAAAHGMPLFKSYDEQREWFEGILGLDVSLFKEFHALIVEWGKRQ